MTKNRDTGELDRNILDKKVLVAASILAADFGKLNEEITSVEPYIDWLHLDLMDNHFVPNLTFGLPVIRCIKTDLFLDAHLMVEHPEVYLEDLAKAGVDLVTVHEESTVHLHRLVTRIRELGMKAGVALNPSTPVESLVPVLGDLDMVLVMSVNPGFGGQQFIPFALEKIRWLKGERSDLLVQVDGGINAETSALCREAGVDILVAGSYIFGAGDRGEAVQSLRI